MSDQGMKLDLTLTGLRWDDFEMGGGVDAITGEKLGSALETEFVGSSSVALSPAVYDYVETKSQLDQMLDLSLKGEYNIASFSASAEVEYISEIKISKETLNIVARVEYQSSEYDRLPASKKIKQEALDYYAKDPSGFREVYGDYFVNGQKTGARFFAVYRCESSDSSKMDSFKASLKASKMDLFSVEGRASFEKKRSDNNITINVRTYMEGVLDKNVDDPEPDRSDIDACFKWFQRNHVGIPQRAELKHYRTLVPTISNRVNMTATDVHDLKMFYRSYWEMTWQYNSLTTSCHDAYQKRYTDLTNRITDFKTELVENKELRKSLQNEIDSLSRDFEDPEKQKRNFMDSLFVSATKEPKISIRNESNSKNTTTWTYGNKASPNDKLFKVLSSEINMPVFQNQFGIKNTTIVGWEVTADKVQGSWTKGVDKIIGTDLGIVNIEVGFPPLAGTSRWRIKYYYVNNSELIF